VRKPSTTDRVVGRLLPTIGAIALCGAALAAAPADTGVRPDSARLPDLDQEVPWDLQVTSAGRGMRREFRLGFASAVRNVGDGALIVSGRRERPGIAAMAADQLVEGADAPTAVVEGVGRLRYVRSRDHEHWHLLDFERYELRPAGGSSSRVTDRKTGFCLGDRYRSRGPVLPGRPAEPRYTGRCGLGETGRLRLVEGISVGYGDDYPANLEGQSLPLTGLPAGRYLLRHSVNVRRRLRETDYGNNAASLLLGLEWRAGAPRIGVLRRCPDTDRCGSSRKGGDDGVR
jgi:lysyl oxidase